MVAVAEEELPASTARQSKQIFLVPSMTPSSTFPLGFYGRSPLAYPLLMPQQDSLIRSDLVEQEPRASGWPYNVPSVSSGKIIKLCSTRKTWIVNNFCAIYACSIEDDEQAPSWRVYDAVDDHGGLKWWKRRFNRQALITLTPSNLGKFFVCADLVPISYNMFMYFSNC